jgi:hypothetical protein
LFLVHTAMDVAACERLPYRDGGDGGDGGDGCGLLVYDIRSRDELLRMLVGDEIHSLVRRRIMNRLAHSRAY